MTIVARAGATHALFLGARMVQGKHIEVQTHVTHAQERDGHLSRLQKLHPGGIDSRQQGLGVQGLPAAASAPSSSAKCQNSARRPRMP